MKAKRAVLCLYLLVCFCSLQSFAQTDRATLSGTVTDSSGAVINGAKVTAIGADTGVGRASVTSPSGSYTIPELSAGPYKITVEAQGFKTVTKTATLAVLQNLRLDFQMPVGSTSDTVTVTEEAPVVQTDSPVQQTNVTTRQVLELPLEISSETAGRSPLSFIYLDSSVSAGDTNNTRNVTNFRVNGSQGLGQNILIDGGTTRRAQNGTFFTEVAPGPDVFQEFTINKGSYSAEFDNSSGGVIDFKLKSGTNAFHGELYEYLRNDILNANSFLNNAQTPPLKRNEDRQNDFGANLGGPVIIPGLYSGRNKTFFFFGYGGYRFVQGENVLVTVPTDKMRTGDFSELLPASAACPTASLDPYIASFFGPNGIQIYDPTQPSSTRAAIPCNRIDLYNGGSVIDLAGQKLIALLPHANRGGVYHNYLASSSTPNNMNSEIVKLDHMLSDRQHLSGSYTHRAQTAIKGGFPRFPAPLVANGVWDQTFSSDYVRVQHDFTISPTLLNHINVSLNRVGVQNKNTTLGMSPSAVLGMPANATQNTGLPRVDFPGYGDPVVGTDPRAYQPFGSTFFSDRQYDNTVDVSDTVSKVAGRHSLRFGASFIKEQLNVVQYLDLGSSTNFRADQTSSDANPGGGWPIASLLTGAAEFSFVSIESQQPGWRYFYPAMFAQDDIKVSRKLTLNVGVRYEIPFPRTETRNLMRAFNPNVINPDVGRPGAIIGAGGQGGLKSPWSGLIPTDYSNVAPRLGMAYSLNNTTVLRAGWGLYYAPMLYGFNGGNNINNAMLGYNILGFLRTPNGPNSTVFLSKYPPAPVPDPNTQLVFDQSGNFLNFNNVDYLNQDFRTGRTSQYSLDIQHQLAQNVAFTLGYTGSEGSRLRSNF